jgi:hypothetical protein
MRVVLGGTYGYGGCLPQSPLIPALSYNYVRRSQIRPTLLLFNLEHHHPPTHINLTVQELGGVFLYTL